MAAVTALLDTHAVLWWLFDDPRLSDKAKSVIAAPVNRILVSSASAWEVATKHRIGKLPDAAEAVEDFALLLRRARFVVSVDSGPMHLAAAVTGDLLGIHTWTDPRKVGPHNEASWVWKAGAIRRVRDLEGGDPSLEENRGNRASALGAKDVEAIGEFVKGRIG